MSVNSIDRTLEPAGKCWVGFREISESLLGDLKAEPFAGARARGPEALGELLATLRRERIAHPVITIGAGTCGLGAGADKTIAAVREFLLKRDAPGEVVEVGCNGMCSDEPIVDIQVPGKCRVSFGPVTADKVDALLEAVLFDGRVPGELALGQYRTRGAMPWDGVRFLEDHPFLAGQVRVVLPGSGIIDPGNINEYIARGTARLRVSCAA